MICNVKICKLLHIGHDNAYHGYTMNGEVWQPISEETDLGVILSNELKPSKQCVSAVKKANMTLGMSKRHKVPRDKNTIVRLYKSLVIPKLEFWIQSWNLSFNKDIELLEKIKHRATKLIPEISHLPYHDRLKYLNLITLEHWRHRGDLIETLKILKGIEGIPMKSLFSLNASVTRGNSLKLNKSRSKLNTMHIFFSQRVVNAWNRLPEKVIACNTVNGFKNAIDRHFREIHEVTIGSPRQCTRYGDMLREKRHRSTSLRLYYDTWRVLNSPHVVAKLMTVWQGLKGSHYTFKSNKAPGPDLISPRLFKEGMQQLVPQLRKLFNLSLRLKKISEPWRKSNLTAIHKKR